VAGRPCSRPPSGGAFLATTYVIPARGPVTP
jgi:hypothetical protein